MKGAIEVQSIIIIIIIVIWSWSSSLMVEFIRFEMTQLALCSSQSDCTTPWVGELDHASH